MAARIVGVGSLYRRSAVGAVLFGVMLAVAPAAAWVGAPQLHDTLQSTIIDGAVLGAVLLGGASQMLKGVRLWRHGSEADRQLAEPSTFEKLPAVTHAPAWLVIRAMWLWGYCLYALVDIFGFLFNGLETCAGRDCVRSPLWTVAPAGAPLGTWVTLFLFGSATRLLITAVIILAGLALLGWIERRVPLHRTLQA